jgi:YD repeat-containing protein
MRSKILLLLCYALLTATALADPNSTTEPDDKNLRTIQPHTRSAAVNAKHEVECEKQGGVDVTDDSKVELGINTADAYFCKIVDKNKYKHFLHQNAQEISYNKMTESSLNSIGINAIINIIPPSGYASSAPFTITGSATFVVGEGGYYWGGNFPITFVGISSVGCSASKYGPSLVGEPHSEQLSINAECTKIALGKQQSSAGGCAGNYNGCTDGSARNSNGIFNFPADPKVPEPAKNEGMPDNPPSCNMPSSFIADPINIAVGNSFQHEVDISGSGAYPLAFIRYYNSVDGIWRHNYSSSVKPSKLYPDTIELTLADGRVVYFPDNKGVITPSATELGTLKRLGTGYQYTSPFHEVLDFDDDGYLTRMTSNGGIVRTLSRHTNKVFVTDNLGYALWITEDAKHQPVAVTSKFKNITDDTVEYKYDNEDRLIKVTIDGASREYHYEDTRFPRALTSITNENGVRYATWTYDDKGRANSNMHAGNKDKVSITYNSDSQTTFTNPLGRKYTYNYTVIDGLKRITSISGAASSLCPAIGSSYQYNTKGLVTLKTDGRGIKTKYDYNDAGQETSRTIASGTSSAVTITTTWDDRFNLPKTETYPDKVITYSYDADGSLVEQTVKSTS